jgi:pimeloyl-ACP methyl ester carboxylesterase
LIERPAPARGPAPAPAPAGRPEACFFRTDGRARFGWVHQPAVASGTALVIVPPFGYEAICSYRSLRHLAEAATRAGLLAVRFDLDGTGDSAGDDLEPKRLEAWLASIDDACELARHQGAERIVLAGVRLGAALAAHAAMRREDVIGLVAIAATPTGKAFVREARALQMQLGLAPPPPGVATPPEDVHELVGFALAAETRTQLAQTDLADPARAQRRPAPAVLLVDRDDLPGNDKWAAALRGLGAEVEQVRLPGYVEMMLDPHRAQVPAKIVEAAVAFAAAQPHTPGAPPPRELVVSAHAEIEVEGTSVTEELVKLDDDLVAVASRLRTPPRRALILINSGSIHRIGPNRLYVMLARRLAARGDLVVRVDLGGIGDSRARRGSDENTVYADHAITDVGAVVAWARRQGVHHVAVAGLCSGAYHALKAAVAGQPIDTVVAINPLTFFWKPGMPLDLAAFRVTADAARYQKSVRNTESWKKLLRGDVDVGRVARVVAERVRAIAEHRGRELARRLRVPLHDDLGSELYALGRRGVAIRFIFASDDPGRAMLVEQGGSAVPRLEAQGKLSIDIIAGPDHTFTPRWSHPLLLDAIVRAVTA